MERRITHGGSKKFLICAEDYAPHAVGGAEQQARLQAEELARRGHHVSVVCPRFGSTRGGVLNDVHVHRLSFFPVRPFGRATFLARLTLWLVANIQEFDCVFVHRASYQTDVTVLLCRLLKRPVWVRIAASGAGDIWRMRRGAIVTRYVGIRHATWVQAISDSIAEEAIALGVPLARIFRIPNGVDTHRFRPATEAEKAKLQETLPITGSTRVVLFAGRFSRQKGLHDLLDAWTMLEGADALLVLVGSTEVRDPVPIPTNLPGVLVRPWVPHIETYYRAADIFVLPSHVEGMSNALLEAMACGLPAVVTRVGANQQVVSDGETGLLLDPGDRPSLQRCLRRLIDDAPLSRLMGERAHVSVGEQYGIERVIDSILQVLATQVHSERSAF